MGTVVNLFLKTAHRQPMTPVENVTAVEARGLEGDLSFGRSTRQVLLIELETLERFGLQPGAVRENITTRGVRLGGLDPGTHLRLGDTLLEITGDCTPCSFIDGLRPGLQEQIVGQRGLLARVVTGGGICVGDNVDVVSAMSFS